MNRIYSSIVFFLFYFFEVLLTILKNGFRNRAAFVSLQFVGFQPSFQVLGAALPKYGESSVIQQSKSFLLSSNLSKMIKLLLSSQLYNWTHINGSSTKQFLVAQFWYFRFWLKSRYASTCVDMIKDNDESNKIKIKEKWSQIVGILLHSRHLPNSGYFAFYRCVLFVCRAKFLTANKRRNKSHILHS